MRDIWVEIKEIGDRMREEETEVSGKNCLLGSSLNTI